MDQTNKPNAFIPFAAVAFIWAGVSAIICGGDLSTSLWMLLFWGLCLLDLAALSMVVIAFIALAAGRSENRGALIIQAFTWGALKLICLGIFAAILLQDFTIPSRGLFSGMATLMVVPLFGGLWWSQRELRHAW